MSTNSPRVPAEWEPQDAVWMTWPSGGKWWPEAQDAALNSFAKLASAISQFITVRINCEKAGMPDARARIEAAGGVEKNISFNICETDDVWCRDSGAIFRINGGILEAIDFKYNAWGGKYPPWNRDDALAAEMAKSADAKDIRIENLVCEGGALEFDGKGSLITTESVVLNPNRNPGVSREQAEEIFKSACGVTNIIWLRDGLANDDTDGHVDNIARFAPGGKIIAAVCGKSNPSYKQLQENLEVLKKAKNAKGESFEIIELPLPEEPVEAKGADGKPRVLPASYANYLLTNGAVIMPGYCQKSDIDAAKTLADAFPDRQVVPVCSNIFIQEGGAVHCLTQQQPSVS